MWKSIKNFFKRIAGCKGISWIFRKNSSNPRNSSYLKSCSAHNQEEDFIILNIHEPTNKPSTVEAELKLEPIISGIYENANGVLELFVTINNTGKVFGGNLGIVNNVNLNTNEILDKLKYRAYIECKKGIFKITFNKFVETNKTGALLSIESLASQDGVTLSSKLEEMRDMLGLSREHATVVVTHISKDPITVPKTVEDGSNTPSSGMTNSKALAANGSQPVRSGFVT